MNFKILGAFISGCIAGATLGIYFTRKHFNDKAEQNVEAFKNYYDRTHNTKNASSNDEKEAPEAVEEPIDKGIERINYNSIYRKITEDYEAKDIPPAESTGKPYVITEDDYINGCPNYTKTELYFYPKDKTLCDENDEPITDYEDLVGSNLDERFTPQGGYDDYIDEIFIRNDDLSRDFQIFNAVDAYMAGDDD